MDEPGAKVVEGKGARIAWIGLSSVYLPLEKAVSDAKVLTGRQKPLQGVSILFARVADGEGREGLGFSYALRSGGPAQYAHARELAPELLGEDPSDIARLWNKLVWRGASAGRSGIALQGLAAIPGRSTSLLPHMIGSRLGCSPVRFP